MPSVKKMNSFYIILYSYSCYYTMCGRITEAKCCKNEFNFNVTGQLAKSD